MDAYFIPKFGVDTAENSRYGLQSIHPIQPMQPMQPMQRIRPPRLDGSIVIKNILSIGSRGMQAYETSFTTRLGTKRRLVGFAAEGAKVRALAYNERGSGLPAFAACANAEAFKLKPFATVATVEDGYAVELALFAIRAKQHGLETVRGACFTRRSLDVGERAAADELAERVPPAPTTAAGTLTKKAREVIEDVASRYPQVRWHLDGKCLRCGSGKHWAKDCPLGRPGPGGPAKEAAAKKETAAQAKASKAAGKWPGVSGWGGDRSPWAGRPSKEDEDKAAKVSGPSGPSGPSGKSGKSRTSGTTGAERLRRSKTTTTATA